MNFVFHSDVYLYLHMGSEQWTRPATCGPDGREDLVEVKSTACVFLVGNMRMIGREADGLKPEAVVGIQEKKEGGGSSSSTPQQ